MSKMKAERPSRLEKAISAIQDDCPMKRMSLNVPKDFHKTLKIFAVDSERTVTDIVVEAVSKYIQEKGKAC